VEKKSIQLERSHTNHASNQLEDFYLSNY